jgi:hypothetical protein
MLQAQSFLSTTKSWGQDEFEKRGALQMLLTASITIKKGN